MRKKIDLHVHSKFSNRPQIYMLSKVKTGECYTEPSTVYEVCKERGMDYVTITDHDTISGALEIAHLKDAFLSEEITAWFPSDNTDVHIVALDISEAQHLEISKLRYNIFDLVSYLRCEQILHYVAHPLSSESKPLHAHHIEQLLLLFKHFEGRNGARDMAGGLAFQRILHQLTSDHLARWAKIHRIDPVDDTPMRYLTGGSDDHGRLSIARAFTEFDVHQEGLSGIREAFEAGRIEMGGQWGTPEILSHNIYYVTVQYFAQTAGRSAFSSFLEEGEDDGVTDTSPAGLRFRVLKDIVEERMAALSAASEVDMSSLIEASQTDAVQGAIGRLGRGIIHRFLSHFMMEFVDAVQKVDLNRAFDAVPGLLTGGSVLLPYLFGYRYHVMDREASEQMTADMGFGYPKEIVPKVVIFSDTGFDVNGVTLSLRNISEAMRGQGHQVELAFCDHPPADADAEWLRQADFVKILPPIGTFELPGYPEMQMGVPSLVDVMEYLARDRVAVVQLSTPGPLGLVAGIAARLMGIKVVANFHTEVHKFAGRIIGDDKVASIVSAWVGWFYGQADRVIVPSRAAAQSMRDLGVDMDKIAVLPRGVNLERFAPEKRNADCFAKHGMNGAQKILYVGRVSKEKDLDTLVQAFLKLTADGCKEDLVIIGDGPYLEELKGKYTHEGVRFLGYRHGEELAQMYASADVLAFPSDNDTFGNAVAEAHASEIPVVVTDRGGPSEQVRHGVNGLIVPAGDVNALADALNRLLGDPSLRRKMGAAGRMRVASMTWDNAAEAQWQFYLAVWGRDTSIESQGVPPTPLHRRSAEVEISESPAWKERSAV